MPLKITTSSNAKGFSLIEVLITLLVVSIGIFGIMGVITISLQLSSSSVYRSIASEQAYAMAEILRANGPALDSGDTVAFKTFATLPASQVANTSTCWDGSTPQGCDRNSYIAAVIYKWKEQLAAVLPSGTGTVCQDSTPYDGVPGTWKCDGQDAPQVKTAPYVVKVCWDESRIAASSSVTGGATGGGTSGSGGVLCTYTNL